MRNPRLPTLAGDELSPHFRARAEGHDYRAALEHLLRELPLERAELLMQRLRESRAAFATLSAVGRGRALLIGDALSGSAVGLARADLDVVLVDTDPHRLAFAADRDSALCDSTLCGSTDGSGARRSLDVVRADPRSPLPFADSTFDLVVDERGAPTESELAELARVARGEVVFVADNRFAYKLSSGVRDDFRVMRPIALARRALAPPHGERTLTGWRGAARGVGLPHTDAHALYPHRFDFSHVVALDGAGPKLTIGPMERANRLKLAGKALGLFPLLTPSFVLRASRTPLSSPWFEQVLERLAHDLGEDTPRFEHLVATRGNTCVVLTHGPGWCIHAPLSPAQERQSRRHFEALSHLHERSPGFPAPTPLWEGVIDGRYLCVESRLSGLSAPQLVGDLEAASRTYADCAEALASLVVEARRPLEPTRLAPLIDGRVEAVAPRTGRSSTEQAVHGIAERLTEELLDRPVPLVIHHSDLRAKHVQVRPTGELVGFMDFGSYERADLPGFDLLNLILHDRKQRTPGARIGDAWRACLESGFEPFEQSAIDRYATLLELPDGYMDSILRALPLLVGAMAESNWDYSRPRWIHRSFGI